MLTAEEARDLLDSIETVRKKPGRTEEPALAGLRDRALIAVMVYTFARVNAVLQMKVCDYFVQGRRGWVRLRERGGKEHEAPCHHNLEQLLDEYIDATGITAYLKNSGKLEVAQHIANHESPRATKLYDRRQDEIRSMRSRR